jgi:hypothetical protein
MEGLWKALDDLLSTIWNLTTPQGWGFLALGAACVGMMWYFNSAGHHKRIAAAIDKQAEGKRILDMSQQTIAEAFELKQQKGEISEKDKEAMYTLLFKNNPQMKELKPDSKDVQNNVAAHLIGMGVWLRTRWPFRSKADEARADIASLMNSIHASKK